MLYSTLRRQLTRVGLVSALLPSGLAIAQETRVQIEEVVVTATKRAQSVNDIPLAVSAYSGESLKNSGIRDVGQLVQVNPTVDFGSTENSSGGSLSIRGMGTLGTDPGLESSVGVFIDGVYRNRSGVALDELGEIERVEVLRGPQGTLFGRNTSAGLIHVVSKGPNYEENEGYAEAQVGNYNLRRLALGATGPLIEGKLAGRVDAIGTMRDGYLKDINGGDDLNDRDRYMVRGQLAWDVNEALSSRFIVDYSKRNEECCGSPTSQKAFGPQDVSTLTLMNSNDKGLDDDADPYDYRTAVTTGRGRQDDTEQWGVSGELTWDLGNKQVVSITAFRDWENRIAGDLDFSGADLLYYLDESPQVRAFETFTQELRMQGAWEGGSWLVGMFYTNETQTSNFSATYGVDLDNYTRRIVDGIVGSGAYDAARGGNSFIAGQGVNDKGVQEAESVAVFTQNDFDLTDSLVLTVGLRYTVEEKDYDLDTSNTYSIFSGGNPCAAAMGSALAASAGKIICGISALTSPLVSATGSPNQSYSSSRKDEEVTGTVKLAYTLANDDLLFFNYARGFKAGGFNQTRLSIDPRNPSGDDLAFERELADTVELGYKGYFLDRSMSFNATIFASEFSDFQLGQFTGVTLETVSVDKVDSRGFEFESSWRPAESVWLNMGAVYTDNMYPSDSNIDDVAPIILADGTLVPRAGKRRTRAVTGTASVSYMPQINDRLRALFYLDARHTGRESSNSSLLSTFHQDAYTVMNLRLGIMDIEETWSAEFWVRNLTKAEYTPISFDPPPVQGSLGESKFIPAAGFNGRIGNFVGEPRTFGVTYRRTF